MKNILNSSLTWKEGTALSISAVIGCGILVLPASTAQKCGPVSIIAWVISSLLCFQIVFVLGKLCAKVPKAGGIASYVEKAFGHDYSAVTTWILMGSIPIGLPSVALSGAYYLGYVLPLSFSHLILISALMLFTSICLNIRGINISSKISSMIVILIISIVIIISSVSMFHVDLNNFKPFTPYGLKPVFSIFSLIFFAFSGFEMICPLAEEFKKPEKDIQISLIISAIFVSILYISLSFVTIGTNTYNDTNSFTFLSTLISLSFGKTSGYVIALLTVLITFCSIHSCISGFSRVIYNAARSGIFPSTLSKIHEKYNTPINSLLFLGCCFTIVLLFFAFISPDLNLILKFPGSVFLFSYIIAMACGLKLFNKYSFSWVLSLICFIVCFIFFILGGLVSLFPIILGGLGFIYMKAKNRNM